MGETTCTLFETNNEYEPIRILKITTPKGVYSQKEQVEIYNSVKEQIGKYLLPIMVPEDVKLAIICEI